MTFARRHLTNLTASQVKKITYDDAGLTNNAKIFLRNIRENRLSTPQQLDVKEQEFIRKQPKRTDGLFDFHSRESRAVAKIGGFHNTKFYRYCDGVGCTPDGFLYKSEFRRLIDAPSCIIEVKSNLYERKSIERLACEHALQIAFQQIVMRVYLTRFVVSYGKEERIETLDIVSDSKTLEKVRTIIRLSREYFKEA